MLTREQFHSQICVQAGIPVLGKAPGYDLEWSGGQYLPKSKNGLTTKFGELTSAIPVSLGIEVFDPPGLTDLSVHFGRLSMPFDPEECNKKGARALRRLSKALGANFALGDSLDFSRASLETLSPDIMIGTKRRYQNVPGSWTAYKPTESDTIQSIVGYADQLIVQIGFWSDKLSGFEIIDVSLVLKNDQEEPELAAATLESLNFESALRVLGWENLCKPEI